MARSGSFSGMASLQQLDFTALHSCNHLDIQKQRERDKRETIDGDIERERERDREKSVSDHPNVPKHYQTSSVTAGAGPQPYGKAVVIITEDLHAGPRNSLA